MKSILTLFLFGIYIAFGYTQRIETNFNNNWQFILDDNPLFSKENLIDTSWQTLNVPHDWSFEKGVRIGGDQVQGGGYHDGGIGWYRKAFNVSKESLSKITYINFDGVYMNSEVWVNNNYLGKRPYAYISFRYDISKYLKAGENTIAVRVDNSLEPSARWYHPCGIYAPVKLVEVNPTHFKPNSIFIKTSSIKTNETLVIIDAEIYGAIKGLKYQVKIFSPEGKPLTRKSEKLKVGNPSYQLQIENPRLWSPETPILYKVITQILDGKKVIEEVETRFGFKTVEWKTETGFWLNGKNIKLKGVCEHWEGGPVGGAWTKPMLRWKLQLLKDMGINAIRPSHNPTPPMFYYICDEIGLLVMDEIFDGWHKKAPEDYGKQAFDEWWQRDIKEWITRDRNHPSIFVWSLGNETHSDVAPELMKFGKSLDPTRLFTSGAGNPEDMDITGVNGGSETKSFIENKKFDKPFISTEAPHTWQTRGYYRTQTWWRDNELPGTYELPNLTDKEIFFYEGLNTKDWKNRKQRFNSSYDNATVRVSARKYWEVMRDTPWHSGHFRWTGFDYYGEAGLVHGGLSFNLFMGGALDVAGFKKDLFYFYKSQWTTEPMVHILPHWTHPRMEKGTVIPIWVYSNTDEVELFLNGKSLGKDKPGTVWNDMQCEWMVPYQEGILEAVAYIDGKEVKRSSFSTSKQPSKLKTSIQKLEAEAGFVSSYIVTSESLDENNNLYPYGENKVYYKIQGDLNDIPNVGLQINDLPMMPSTEWAIESGEWKKIIQAYLACISYVDYELGRVLDALENSKYVDNTIIVLWLDHGYRLGEKGTFAKHALWETATKAPLMFAGPTLPKGKKMDAPVEMLSIYPTLLELSGLPAYDRNEGNNLVSMMKNDEGINEARAITSFGMNNHTVKVDGYRYIRYEDGTEEFYDHSSDPNEWTNEAETPKYKTQIELMKGLLPKVNSKWDDKSSYTFQPYFVEQKARVTSK